MQAWLTEPFIRNPKLKKLGKRASKGSWGCDHLQQLNPSISSQVKRLAACPQDGESKSSGGRPDFVDKTFSLSLT
jgi:hypothetical protein